MKYSVKWADLRMRWFANSRPAAEMEGSNQRRRGSMIRLVCSEEKVSVEKRKMTAAQKKAGHQERSQEGIRGERLLEGRLLGPGCVGDMSDLVPTLL